MKNILSMILCLILVLGGSGIAKATLYDRGGGLIYDSEWDVTWIQDAHYAATALTDAWVDSVIGTVIPKPNIWELPYTISASDFQLVDDYRRGYMTWWAAMLWADQLVYGGYDDWRLPTPLMNDGNPWPVYGYGINSEIGHIYYYNEDGKTYKDFFTNTTAINIIHWTSMDGIAPGLAAAVVFSFDDGNQDYKHKNVHLPFFLVRDGDVAPIPEPTTMLLLGSGLLGLAGIRWRGRKKSQKPNGS